MTRYNIVMAWRYLTRHKFISVVNIEGLVVGMIATIFIWQYVHFISCLGLFALVSFVSAQMKQEIGVRKVLGATVPNIIFLIIREFLGLIIIAFALTVPVSWYFMEDWLSNFAIRIDIKWTFYLIAGIATILISLLTISFQGVKAALANPANSIRTE